MVNSRNSVQPHVNGAIANYDNNKKRKKKRKKKKGDATGNPENASNATIDPGLMENQLHNSALDPTSIENRGSKFNDDSVRPKKVVVIAGDSMVKDVVGREMSSMDPAHFCGEVIFRCHRVRYG